MHRTGLEFLTEEPWECKRSRDNSEGQQRTRLFYIVTILHCFIYFCFEFIQYIIILLKCSAVPASFFPDLHTSLHWCRNSGEGGTRCHMPLFHCIIRLALALLVGGVATPFTSLRGMMWRACLLLP